MLCNTTLKLAERALLRLRSKRLIREAGSFVVDDVVICDVVSAMSLAERFPAGCSPQTAENWLDKVVPVEHLVGYGFDRRSLDALAYEGGACIDNVVARHQHILAMVRTNLVMNGQAILPLETTFK